MRLSNSDFLEHNPGTDIDTLKRRCESTPKNQRLFAQAFNSDDKLRAETFAKSQGTARKTSSNSRANDNSKLKANTVEAWAGTAVANSLEEGFDAVKGFVDRLIVSEGTTRTAEEGG